MNEAEFRDFQRRAYSGLDDRVKALELRLGGLNLGEVRVRSMERSSEISEVWKWLGDEVRGGATACAVVVVRGDGSSLSRFASQDYDRIGLTGAAARLMWDLVEHPMDAVEGAA
jgi:hypothetical protein